KVDRGRLPDPVAVAATAAVDTDLSPTERVITDVWTATLGVSPLGPDDDFFDLGGHSLAAIQAVTRIRRALPDAGDLGVGDLFRHPTVRRLAAHLTERSTVDGPTMLFRLTPAARAAALTY